MKTLLTLVAILSLTHVVRADATPGLDAGKKTTPYEVTHGSGGH